MCVTKSPFDKEDDHRYTPDWEQWKASGNLCSGMGDSPKCKVCGRKERYHEITW